ncbi:pyridoxal phosphate-dependent transferase [Xylariales sp. PMI_506]|nr:pyridoxal phosphate-dependent transferase [Xylariales sp. PMI_506]
MEHACDELQGSVPEIVPLGGNSWLHPGQAAFDFRGDVRTSPTAEMHAAVTSSSLLDDIDRSDPTTKDLEAYVAKLAGKEAGLFVPSGTMGNLVSLRSLLTRPPYAILCDSRSHIFSNEAGGAFAFTGAIPQLVQPSNGQYLTLEDVMEHIKIEPANQKVHMCPTRVISLENTLRGMVQPLIEARRISDFAHQNGVLVHIDGARLWEVVAGGHGSLQDYCSVADTVTMCFSKGLGAPAGAVVVGSEEVIRHARWIRQSIGGSIRQPGLLAAAAHVAVKETFEKGKLSRTHKVAADIAAFWEACGGKLLHPTHTNMVWLDFSGLDFTLQDMVKMASTKSILVHRDRLVVHYQICDEAIESLKATIQALFKQLQ